MSADCRKNERLPERAEMPTADCWDLTPLYPRESAWEDDFNCIDGALEPLLTMRGMLNTPRNVSAFLEYETSLDRLLERLYVYAHLRSDENTADSDSQALLSRIRSRLSDVSAQLAWALPELLDNDEKKLQTWLTHPALKADRYALIKILRRKPHILPAAQEELLSRAAEVLNAPERTFSLLSNADLRFPDIRDAQGRAHELSEGRYLSFLQDPDRELRRKAFESLLGAYGAFRNTLASTLAAAVRRHNFSAQARDYPSALEASLHGDAIPATLYHVMIDATRKSLPRLRDYLLLRARALKLDSADMYDLYVPLSEAPRKEIPFSTARDWVLESCRPLGSDYCKALQRAFDERWIDVYENRGKRSGAYSSGCYDSRPYILMNYTGRVEDVFTLAHELGHSMHTLLANQTQPHRYASYPIFLAEIASTLNEYFLLHFLLKNNCIPRVYLLQNRCDRFRATVYRQVMFAEFELEIHLRDARNEPLTPAKLDEIYRNLNSCYYPSISAHELISHEWARIPHFYYNFYVYKYATSFCASRIFAQRILAGGKAEREAYLGLLRSGGSDDPLKLLRNADVDLTDAAVLESSFSGFTKDVEKLEKALHPRVIHENGQ